jgi:integrase/recombinase XerD
VRAWIGRVLNIRVKDIHGRKILVHNPKTGKEAEAIFLPEPVANRVKAYVQQTGLTEEDRVFNFCYSTARKIIAKLGKKVGIKLNPHDLRGHPATFASRNGMPLEITSKVRLRHEDLKTTQVYLGKVSEAKPFAGWTSFTVNDSIGIKHPRPYGETQIHLEI